MDFSLDATRCRNMIAENHKTQSLPGDRMPNLERVVNDPDELRRSIARMSGSEYARGDVRFNHGICSPEEMQALVCQPPYKADDLPELQAAFEEMNLNNGQSSR
jgi:hypothetical protein